MEDYTEDSKKENVLRECLNRKFIGIYRYSEKVYASEIH